MLFQNKFKLIGGLILLGLSTLVHAQELQLWRVGKEVPVFYQEASESSQKLPELREGQIMLILQEKKDWIQLVNIESKKIGWVLQTKVNPRWIMNLAFNQTANAYGYHIKIQNPEGTQTSEGQISKVNFNSYASKRVQNFRKNLSSKLANKVQEEGLKQMEDMFDHIMEKFWFPLPVMQPMIIVASQQNTTESNNKPAQPLQEQSTQQEEKTIEVTHKLSDNSNKKGD